MTVQLLGLASEKMEHRAIHLLFFHTDLYEEQFWFAVKTLTALQWLNKFPDLYLSIFAKDQSLVSVT